MKSASDPFARLLSRAAEMRFRGLAWSAVAESVHRSVKTCSRWPDDFPELWKQAMREAEANFFAEAGREALHSLRSLLRSEDEKTVRDAALALLRSRAEFEKIEPATGPATDPLQVYLASLSHDDQARFLDDLLADDRRPPASTDLSMEVDASAPRPE